MKDWLKLSKDERQTARAGRGHFELRAIMDDNLAVVLALLKGDAEATHRAWKIAWGNYLINTPAEIAAYCTKGDN